MESLCDSPIVADVLAVEVPAMGRVLVAGDIHLPATAAPAATWAGRELSDALDEWVGPGVLVLGSLAAAAGLAVAAL